jgi:hypothetical protein
MTEVATENNRRIADDMIQLKKEKGFSALYVLVAFADDSGFVEVGDRGAMLSELTKQVNAHGVPLGYVGIVGQGALSEVESRIFPMFDDDPAAQKGFDRVCHDFCENFGLSETR